MKPLKTEPPHLAPPLAISNNTEQPTKHTHKKGRRRKPGKCNRKKTLHKVLTFSWWFGNREEKREWKGMQAEKLKKGEMKLKAQTQRRRRNQYKHKLVKSYRERKREQKGEGEETEKRWERGIDTHLWDAADETADAHWADYPVAVKQRRQQHKRMTATAVEATTATTGAATTISSASQGRNPCSCSHLP